ncbi:hypothetical protein NM208_g5785 [Fusarium decemcellulare]|uniref:Uncharacterized protein n=1 Tax=Fusarium decemcellulare TaxID=57161 RepID=A0ACC1SFR7_9HYPO|nr:hypothetical protein NM208_g5785 [Fusarium decemcellulare]
MVDKLFAPSHLSAFLDLLLKEALKTPYLMDELLAFAAAHKSTICNDGQLYQVEATRLQTRALNQFNIGQMEVTEQNCMAVFTFSALLGQHSLFDAFSAMTDLSTVLDKLTHCISLHRGIRAIAGESWERIHSLLQEQAFIDLAHMAVDIPTTSGIECDGLLQRLQSADISQRTIAHYEQAVKILQYLFDSSKASESRRLTACQEFLVRVSADYISLLERRQPEALVIISYYGVLLHQAKDYWTIGDSGRFLINAVSGHLGTYWAEWLAWPNEALE